MKRELIRKTFPKIRTVQIKGEWFYQVDGRRRGTNGKRETFAKKSEAEKRAAEIEKDFEGNGVDGLAMPAELRAMAAVAERILAPFGKTIVQAAEFYRDHLTAEKAKDESAVVGVLAKEWFEDKNNPVHKLKGPTLKGIRQTSNLLQRTFPRTRIRTLGKQEAREFIFSLNGDYNRENTRNRCGQFMNWCIANGHADSNPFDSKTLIVTIAESDIQIFNSRQARQIMELCEKGHGELLIYTVISLFAGLRPGEVEALTWENIHMDERQIHVLGSTSKSKVTHNVDIEENLYEWLRIYRPKKEATGFICPQGTTLKRRRQELHAALGFRAAGENKDAPEIVQDIMRHSYASHWQAKYTNAHKLAEMMANSVEVIRNHYKKVVSKPEIEAYWSILPAAKKRARKAAKPIPAPDLTLLPAAA
jgi:integrase